MQMDCALWVHSFSHLLFVRGKQMYCLLLCTVESLVQQLLMSLEIKTSAYGKQGMRSQFLWLRWSCSEIYLGGLLSSQVWALCFVPGRCSLLSSLSSWG